MSETTEAPRIQLNGPAPDFKAQSTLGEIQLSTFAPGKWVVLFSHPADFTPVCTTEFVEFARRQEEFDKRNVQLIGNSIDSVYSHVAWAHSMEKNFDVQIRFPIIADLDQKVARAYGMVHEASAATAPVRCVYFIDPKRVLRAMIYYPLNIGRNFDEIIRVIDALQASEKYGVSCPANWKPGDDFVVGAPTTVQGAAERLQDKSLKVTDWYISKKSI